MDLYSDAYFISGDKVILLFAATRVRLIGYCRTSSFYEMEAIGVSERTLQTIFSCLMCAGVSATHLGRLMSISH